MMDHTKYCIYYANVLSAIKEWGNAFAYLLFPRCCIVCNRPLAKGEEVLCTVCNINLPRTNFHLQKDNYVEQLLWGKMPLVRATSFFYYQRGSDFCQLLYALKYNGQKEVGETMGRYMATELMDSGFFNSIDVIIPVPLHKKRQRWRGYNQSEWIARGISAVTKIPVDVSSVIRCKYTETQTHKSMFERWENIRNIFELTSAASLTGKHVLIVDDVLTTGATTVACSDCLTQAEGVRISVLTLAVAKA